ncbi:MAG: hypothetical protein Q8R48_07230, partial [Candidatus Omnitrophota bacterium]|nr:hypothetical protein [Candidatus Omnitrophota bacterium]
GISFTDLFDDAAHRSKKLFWVAEFGVDAWHTNNKRSDPSVGYLDEASQAQWDAALWDEIAARGDVCTGGTVFEYSDEWWKDHSGADSSHGYVGYPIDYKMTNHPDEYSNEEWYGLFAVTDNGTGPDIVTARPVYYELKSRWAGSQQPEPAVHVEGITLSLTYSGPFVTANAVVTIYDESGQPASGATVSGVWSGLASDSDIGTTNSSGQVTLISNKARNAKSGQQFTFTVSDVALGGHIYDYAANVETSDSISIP